MAITFLDLEGTPGTNVAPNWTALGFTNGIVDGTPLTETMKFTNGAGKVRTGSTAIEIQGQANTAHAYGWIDLNTPRLAVQLGLRLPASPVVSGLDYRFIDITSVGATPICRFVINSANKMRLNRLGSTPVFTLTAAHPTATYLIIKVWAEIGTSTTGKLKLEVWDDVTDTKIHGSTVYSLTNLDLGTANIGQLRVGSFGGWGGLFQIDSVAYDPAATDVMPTQPVDADPTASFIAIPSDLSVNFNASASSDPGGSIVSYAWTFGDSTTGTGMLTSHTYASAGTYTVGLIVTDNDGNPSTNVTHSVTVTDPPSGVAVDIIDSDTVSGGATSIAELNIPCDASTGAQANDLIVGYIANERGSSLPTLAAGSLGLVIAYQDGTTNLGITSFYKRLTATDISFGMIKATFAPIRRAVAGYEIQRGGLNPTYSVPAVGGVSDAGGAGPGVLTAPGITPSAINSYIRAQFAVAPVAAPFTRTFTPPAGWTEIFEDHAGAGAGVEPFIEGIAKQLGATTAPVTGPSVTPNDVSTHMAYYAVTFAVAPAPIPPAVSDAGDDIALIDPDTWVQLDGSGSTGKGPLTFAWRVHPSNTGPTPFGWSSQTVMNPQIRVKGAMTQQVLTLGLIVTDADGDPAPEDTMTITILAASEGYFKSNGSLSPYVDQPL